MCANYIFDERLVPKKINTRNCYNSMMKRHITQIRDLQTICVDVSPRKIYKWPRKHMKIWSTSSVIGNANENPSEVSLHILWDGYKNNKIKYS